MRLKVSLMRERFVLMRAWLLALGLCLLSTFAPAHSPQPVPELTGRVMDATGTLSAAQKDALSAKLAEFEKTKGSQIVVLMVPTTQPETIEAYANRVASSWKVGRKEVGDGIVVVVAKNDRKLRIEVARTLEGAVTDLQAKRIIDEAITPQFKQGNFDAGLNQGVDQLMQLVNGEALPDPSTTGKFSLPLSTYFWGAVFVLVNVWLGATYVGLMIYWGLGIGVGALVWWLTDRFWLAFIATLATYFLPYWWLTRGLSSGAGSGGATTHPDYPSVRISREEISSSGSGWFGSGGGGSFGGGGASGSW